MCEQSPHEIDFLHPWFGIYLHLSHHESSATDTFSVGTPGGPLDVSEWCKEGSCRSLTVNQILLPPMGLNLIGFKSRLLSSGGSLVKTLGQWAPQCCKDKGFIFHWFSLFTFASFKGLDVNFLVSPLAHWVYLLFFLKILRDWRTRPEGEHGLQHFFKVLSYFVPISSKIDF